MKKIVCLYKYLVVGLTTCIFLRDKDCGQGIKWLVKDDRYAARQEP